MSRESYVERLVHRILSGKRIVNIKNRFYEIRTPSIDLRVRADNVYQQFYEDNLFDNFILEEDLEQYLINCNIISWDHNKIIESNEKRLDKTKIQLYIDFADPKKRKKHKNTIKNIRKTLDSLHKQYHTLSFLVLENFAQSAKQEFLLSNTLYDCEYNSLVFNSTDTIEYVFYNELIEKLNTSSIDVTEFKEIARSDYWRNYYTNNKSNVFPYPAIEYSEEQKALINITTMYEKIYEHPESPDEDIIEDDDALDGWMLKQKEENIKQKKEKGVDNMVGDKIKNSSELFLMSGGDEERAQEILDLNSAESRQKIRTRQQMVGEQKEFSEIDIPDVRQDLRDKLRELNRKN